MAAAPGERRLQILQALAAMLEDPAGEKVTTAALAGKLDVSEAALYRHFASKAQMYEGLIEFIESSLFTVINRIVHEEENGLRQVEMITASLLRFSAKNPGLTRVLIGDALVHEHPRLQARINQIVDRIDATLRQAIRVAATQKALPEDHDAAAHAATLVCYVIGTWHRFAKGGFKDDPLALWPRQWPLLAA